MSDLIDHLARMARLRDGDVLELAIAGLTCELLRCDHLAIHRVVNDGGTRRWLTTATASAGQAHAQGVAPGELSEWPRFDERPAWRACVESLQPHSQVGERVLTLYPFSADSAPTGVVEIETPAPLDANQERTVGSLLRFYRHLRGLIDENERDSLTRLLNRKSFDSTFFRTASQLATEAACPPDRQERRKRPTHWKSWLGVIDIDHFKRINDRHGHLIGDEVLLLLAQLMSATIRHGDRLYRFGGEEFVILLRTPNAAAAAQAFERLRRTIQHHVFPQIGSLTVSIGYTAVEPGDNPSAAFERADRAVYHAKETGRNRVVAHAALESARQVEPAHGEIELF